MPVNDELGMRMKHNYEEVSRTRLTRRTPVAIRIDGKAFHTFTRGFEKPFDEVLMKSMQETMKYLCENIQGCVFGYTQSDEITLILIDYQTLTSDAWFDYEVQKLCSISASMATAAFTVFFNQNVDNWQYEQMHIYNSDMTIKTPSEQILKLNEAYSPSIGSKIAMFDSRCFNIPKEEVTNLIYWRQLDATRNSIQMVGQANFSHKELQGLSCEMIQNKLLTEKNINWNDYSIPCKRGTAWTKEIGIDYAMPILKGENRKYVDKLIMIGE